jgi:PAS domain S-box-containing protein
LPEPLIPADKLARLFDALPDVVFFVKNREGRYTHVNQTLVRRLGLSRRDDVIEHDPAELFPHPLGARYRAQDRQVLAGQSLENQLEVHLFPDRASGWCLTCKYPLRQNGEVIGVIGISRDLGRPDERHPIYDRLMRVVDHLETHYAENVRMETLAQLAELSIAQLERHFRRVFLLNPGQMLTKLRIDAAMRLLREPGSIAAIGQACGYADQSAFSRQFRRLTGLAPGQYRALRG